MKSRVIHWLCATCVCFFASSALASNLRAVRIISADALNYANQGGYGSILRVTYAADYQGLDHACQLTYSTDGWRSSNIVAATFSHVSASSEIWNASATVPSVSNANFVYSFACTDLGQTQTLYAASGSLSTYGVTVRDQPRTITASHY